MPSPEDNFAAYVATRTPAEEATAQRGMKQFADAVLFAQQQRPVVNTDADVIADKELRVSLDASLQTLKALPSSRERSLSITKIQEAIMWLGMDLKRLNDTRPYPSSYDPTNAKVEPTSDGLKL